MKKLIAIILSISAVSLFFALTTSTYDLVAGSNVKTLRVHNNPLRIQNDIISRLKPLWEDLDSGESNLFFCRRTVQDGDLSSRLGAIHKNATVSSTMTTTIGNFRFFKNRDGENGMEVVDSKGNASPMINGAHLSWDNVERYLRNHILDEENIQRMIILSGHQ